MFFNPIQDAGGGGGGKKAPATRFSSITSANIGISTKNPLTFSFNPFCHTGVKFEVRT